jgi:hypothetical protein
MIEGQLIARKVNDDPPAYRISFDGVEDGSIAKRTQHVQLNDYWHWGVATMPLMDHGGHPPSGDAWSLEAAMNAFKEAFTKWHAELPPGLWERNRDYIKHAAERWRKRT